MAQAPGKVVRGKIDKVVKKPPFQPKQLPPDLKRGDLDLDEAFGVEIGDDVATFVPVKGIFGNGGDLSRLTRADASTVGIIINCEKDVWYVESEATEAGTAGITVYAPQPGKDGWRSRKPILAGECKTSGSGGNASVKFDLKTIYDGIRSSPKENSVSVGGSVSNGPAGTTYTVTGTFTIKF